MSAMPLLQLPKITRCVKEVIAIKQRKPSLKSEEGLYLSAMAIYNPLLGIPDNLSVSKWTSFYIADKVQAIQTKYWISLILFCSEFCNCLLNFVFSYSNGHWFFPHFLLSLTMVIFKSKDYLYFFPSHFMSFMVSGECYHSSILERFKVKVMPECQMFYIYLCDFAKRRLLRFRLIMASPVLARVQASVGEKNRGSWRLSMCQQKAQAQT